MSVQEKKSEIEADQEIETEVQPTVEAQPDVAVLNQGEVLDATDDVSASAQITDYTAPRSNINHGHDTDKHDVRSSFNVRDEFVSEHFSEYGIAPNYHAALWLMSYKKDEFIAADEPIFSDTSDTDSSRWSSIENVKSSAPIAPETQQELKR